MQSNDNWRRNYSLLLVKEHLQRHYIFKRKKEGLFSVKPFQVDLMPFTKEKNLCFSWYRKNGDVSYSESALSVGIKLSRLTDWLSIFLSSSNLWKLFLLDENMSIDRSIEAEDSPSFCWGNSEWNFCFNRTVCCQRTSWIRGMSPHWLVSNVHIGRLSNERWRSKLYIYI